MISCSLPILIVLILPHHVQAIDPLLNQVYDRVEVERPDWVIHDPSQVITKGKKQMIAVTGKENAGEYNCGLETWWRKKNQRGKWKPGQCLFTTKPDWIAEETPDNDGAFWAPELVNENTILYSVSDFNEPDKTCVGIAFGSGTFPKQKTWEDSGEPMFCIDGSEYEVERSAIDPSIFTGFDGKTYLVTGGGSIIATELDPITYMPTSNTWYSDNDPDWYNIARGPVSEDNTWVEAAYVFPHDGYYYLFVNWGACCSGVNSTYEIRIGRSTSPFGPYIDKNDVDMMNGGGSLFLKRKQYRIGPGHASIYKKNTNYFIQYHYYDKRRGGTAWAAEQRVTFNKNGWPRARKLESKYQYELD